MLFRVVALRETLLERPNHAYLVRDEWNDWFKWVTQFHLWVCDATGVMHRIGDVKIGQRGMGDKNSPTLPEEFEELDESFFSLGQSEDYYESLNKLGSGSRNDVLRALR